MVKEILNYYIIYSILIGLLFFSIKYLLVEKKIIHWGEFFLIILLPVIGLGNWTYNRKLRFKAKMKFTREYFIWKELIPLNIGFLLFLTILLIIRNGLLGNNLKLWLERILQIPTHGHGGYISINLPNWLEIILTLFFYIFLLGTLYLILVLFPKYRIKQIEKTASNTI